MRGDLAGLCGLTDSDDAALCARLASRVNELKASPLKEVRDLAIACQIASRLPSFAESLWLYSKVTNSRRDYVLID
jgi:hypothetical protein